jgi:hypothetical protein
MQSRLLNWPDRGTHRKSLEGTRPSVNSRRQVVHRHLWGTLTSLTILNSWNIPPLIRSSPLGLMLKVLTLLVWRESVNSREMFYWDGRVSSNYWKHSSRWPIAVRLWYSLKSGCGWMSIGKFWPEAALLEPWTKKVELNNAHSLLSGQLSL